MKMLDEDIIKACKRKDQKAFRIVYETYSPKMMGISLRYMKNRFEAEEVLQDSFIKLYLTIDKYKFKGSFEAWLRKIVVNTAINKLRSVIKNEMLQINEEVLNIKDSSEAESEHYSSFENPEGYSMDEMLTAIQQLSDRNRVIFNLSEIEGYSVREIANETNLSEHTVRSTLSRAKTIIRINLEKNRKANDAKEK
ncbi:MAG: RNA polymerase sigma factor [Bacteroidales bacterium]|jgi:RNA polymerase sigma-70 factor (ECF subfamily)|nr:RNA polymerase sigma factor [Bacteroidales bacterium]